MTRSSRPRQALRSTREELRLGKTQKSVRMRSQHLATELQAALEADGFLPSEAAREAALHLTDWLTDLADFTDLLRADVSLPDDEVRAFLLGFLAHVPNHLNAAHRIMCGRPVQDLFELGAVKGSGRARRKPGAPYRAHEPAPTPSAAGKAESTKKATSKVRG